jgi:uncharacterized protein
MEINVSEEISGEYLSIVQHILEDASFQELTNFTQHYRTTRLMHSLNVSYLSWKVAKKLGLDAQIAARAGLLHDFCLYDFRERLPKGTWQAFHHPKVAAQTSQEHFELHEKEHQAILSHMFPLGPIPRSREAWLISGIDKLCACTEFFQIRVALARRNRVTICPA